MMIHMQNIGEREDAFDRGNPNKDFREFKSVVKSQEYANVRKAGGGAKEQERRRKQLERRSKAVQETYEISVRGPQVQD